MGNNLTDEQLDQITSRVRTLEDAYAVIIDVGRKFDMVGTYFSPADVHDLAETWLGDESDRDATPAEIGQIEHSTLCSYSYRKLGERLAEYGNEILCDEVSEAIGHRQTATRR
ncbi:MAG: hypothetical protein L0H59_12600 [Tomitella sp.]|nr:hypothetical protein [Tomitella sp.]